MADIHIKMKHDKDAQKLQQHIASIIEKEAGKFYAKVAWEKDMCHFSGPAVGTLQVQNKQIDVQIKLGLLTKPFEGEIAKNVETALQKAIQEC